MYKYKKIQEVLLVCSSCNAILTILFPSLYELSRTVNFAP